MNLRTINRDLLYDDDLILVAGLSEQEKETLLWLRNALQKYGPDKIDLTAPNIAVNMIKSIVQKLNHVSANKESFYGFKIIKQLGKEGWFIVDSKGKVLGRIQYVDDRI